LGGLESKEQRGLRRQSLLGQLASVVTAPLLFLFVRLMGWRIRNLNAVRAEVAYRYWNHEGPWLVCANHLTMVDSLLISYGIASLGSHVLQFGRLPWNLPERKNFQSNPLLALLCYLGKCLPVDRGGDREDLQLLLEKCRHLLDGKNSLMIFPEGGRSRTGRVERENYTYGVGRFLDEFDQCRVLLVYLRGDRQWAYGAMPRWGETFTLQVESFDPRRMPGTGLRLQREYARQIVEKLARMDEAWFAGPGE
jgi:1-acyl-sn-glycerol-3-phosphate acyltransferase